MSIASIPQRRLSPNAAGIAVSAAIAAIAAVFMATCRADTNAAEASFEAKPSQSGNPGISNTLSVSGKEGWLFSTQELVHLGKPQYWAGAGDSAVPGDPMPAILDFKRQLDAAGIGLLMVPVPPKAVVYADKLPGDPPSMEQDRAFYRALESRGVNVLDLTEAFLAARTSNSPPLYCKQDTHWAPEGIRIATDRIAEKIRAMQPLAGQSKAAIKATDARVTVKGDLARGQQGICPEEETLAARFVGNAEGGGVQPVESSRSSPVVLLGDSHNLIFHAGGDMHATGCGLPDQLSLALGFPVDLVAVRGSGSTSARRNLARRKDNLDGKKLVIWCFTAREFTEGEGWLKVPVTQVPGVAAGSARATH